MDHESAKKLLFKKKMFKSYEEFKAHFEEWERQTNSVYTIVSSKPLTVPPPATGDYNPDLKYCYLRMQCKFGGPRRFRGTGIRKTLTHKMDCPAYVNIKWSADRQHLVFGNMELQHHNHPQSEEAYRFLTERRNLSRSTRKEADKMLKTHNEMVLGDDKKSSYIPRTGWINTGDKCSLEAIEKLVSDNTDEAISGNLRNITFSTEEELLQWIKNYEEFTGQKYKTFWSTRITQHWFERGFTNTNMGYKQVAFICEQADASELRKKDEGEPQCPASIYIGYTPDKQFLRIKKINDNHVHKAQPTHSSASTSRNNLRDEKWEKRLQNAKSKFVDAEIIQCKDEQFIDKDMEYKAAIDELKTTINHLESIVEECKTKVYNLEAQIYSNDTEIIVGNEEVMWAEEISVESTGDVVEEGVTELTEIPEYKQEVISSQRGPVSFFDRDAAVQRFFLLKWLLPAERLIYVLNRDVKINANDIFYCTNNPDLINDSYLEAKQELQLISDDFEYGVLDMFKDALERKVENKIYLCDSCGAIKDLNDWLLCDGCLIWCHTKCIEVYAEVGGHFCQDCTKTIF